MSKNVAVVTGSNKGIGFAIVRGLCKGFHGDVFLTARNESLGKAAVADLEKEGLKPQFHQLDITDVSSITRLRDFLVNQYQGLDVLVNNAGVAFKRDSTAPFAEQAEVTRATNFCGTLQVCRTLFPVLKSGARVVNMSSDLGLKAFRVCSSDLQSRLKSLKTIPEVEEYMMKFVQDTSAGQHTTNGWPNTAYGTAKIGLTLITPMLQEELDKDQLKPDQIINACCPGHVQTDMSSYTGSKTADEGADTPVFLALLPPNTSSPCGKFVQDRKILEFPPQ